MTHLNVRATTDSTRKAIFWGKREERGRGSYMIRYFENSLVGTWKGVGLGND
jgi:hypothetical protein